MRSTKSQNDIVLYLEFDKIFNNTGKMADSTVQFFEYCLLPTQWPGAAAPCARRRMVTGWRSASTTPQGTSPVRKSRVPGRCFLACKGAGATSNHSHAHFISFYLTSIGAEALSNQFQPYFNLLF